MKRLMMSLVVIAVFAVSNTVNAQEPVSKDTTETKIISTPEKEIKKIVHEGITYFIINGTWHTKIMHGKKLYKCKGIFYKLQENNIYEVVRI